MKNVLAKIVTGICLLTAAAAQAAWLENVPITLHQPDGSELRCFASGDEYHNWLHDAGGFTIVKNPGTGFYVYAIKVKNTLLPSDYIAGRSNPVTAGLTPRQNLSPAQMMQQRSTSLLATLENPVDRRPAPNRGAMENLVVFIRFAGEAEFSDAVADYEHAFNDAAAGALSLYNYMLEVSYGALNVHASFYPVPTAGTIISYQDVHPRGYYKPRSDDPLGYATPTEQAQREQTLIKNAVEAIRSQVPADLNLDGDLDGRVDNMIFIIKGSPTGWNTLLWPHAWALFMYQISINGKRVYGYNLQMQSFMVGGQIHLLCHELLHSIGFPDLYHYDFDGLHPVLGWDIMASPTSPPQHPGAYGKWKYGKWIPFLPLIDRNGHYKLKPLSRADSNCYRIPSPNDPSGRQYFVVEYRRKSDNTFESGLGSEGLLVYRIDNRDPYHHGNATLPDEIYIYRPGGTPTTNGIISRAPLALEYGRIALNDTTDPGSFLADGSPGGLDLFGVSELGETISFHIGVTAPEPPALLSPENHATEVKPDPILCWLPAAGAFRYQVQVSQNPEFSTLLYDFKDITKASQTLFGLNENMCYYWRVRAFNLEGVGLWSEIRQFTTGGIPPAPPANVRVINYSGE
ncbi:hypothetical protein JXO59_12495 [candidate division KSB1 bacterium]|nr:hypothetical protein [candidate division KSB1 bacterium]